MTTTTTKTTMVMMALTMIATCAGCAALDTAFGVDATGTDLGTHSPADVVGGIAGGFAPWGAAAVSALGWLYGIVRGRRYKTAAHSVIDTIAYVCENSASLKNFDDATIAELLAILERRQIKSGSHEAVKMVRSEIEKASKI